MRISSYYESSEDEFYITATEIRDYLFCPMILYNKYVRGLKEPITILMIKGSKKHEREKELVRRRKTLLGLRKIKPDKILCSQLVASKRLRICGIIDTIFWIGSKAYILEVKDSNHNKIPPDHLYQTVAYAIMAEETYKTIISKIYIYYTQSKKLLERKITRELRQHIENIIKEIMEIIKGEKIPNIKYTVKCKSCWYNRICHANI